MSCIVYQTNKRTGIKYAYESFSYWDPDKKQPRSKRKYIGRVDPETGEIIPSKCARSYDSVSADNSEIIDSLRKELAERDALIASLQNELYSLTEKYTKAIETIQNITSLTESFTGKQNA